jgi:hypothetical protein
MQEGLHPLIKMTVTEQMSLHQADRSRFADQQPEKAWLSNADCGKAERLAREDS